jgi:hypothetical protein
MVEEHQGLTIQLASKDLFYSSVSEKWAGRYGSDC